ncbi:MAG: CpsD/CapB family tyrosine-protein kinase [Clostridia bacterium]|nr:CpsD/CapB family tyrosine-protein kinase [Clostridia bacterium]
MKLMTKLFGRAGKKRRDKMQNKPSNGHRRGEYVIGKKTPFELTEAFRNLKATLSVSVPKKEQGGVAIMVTSSYPEEGKTTVAVNLSVMFAQSSTKVILIDADIRKGRVAKYFGEKSADGLSDYLSGQKPLNEVIKKAKTESGSFDYISCGIRSPKPYELLESDMMKGLLEELRSKYDYVIIDTPPVLLVSDALALAPNTDGAVIVCRHMESYVSDIARTLNSLTFVKANVLGVIVNDYEEKVKKGYGYGGYKKYHYYSRYGYKYGYKYEYGSTNPEDTETETENKQD